MPTDKPLTILLAEDDPDDRFLLQTAFIESSIEGELKFVNDGEELMDYLFRQGKYAKESDCPSPNVVLLDLNMPRKDGREALQEIKGNPVLCNLPVVVLTTSNLEQDLHYCREMGVDEFIVKPNNYSELLKVMKTVKQICQ